MSVDVQSPKPVRWVGSAKRDIRRLPVEVREVFGFALYLAQWGQKHLDAKPLKGFTGAGVLEIVENHRGDTYRAVYTVRFAGVVYVLHVFQKKSKSGMATPPHDLNLVRDRLKAAEADYEGAFP